MTERVVIVCQLRRFLMPSAAVGMCVCWGALHADEQTHMTEPTGTAHNVDIAQRMRPANLRHNPLSNLRFCP